MNWQYLLNGLQFKDDKFIHNQIEAIAAMKLYTLIHKSEGYLSFEFQTTAIKFYTQTMLIDRFQEAGTSPAMDFDCRFNDLP